MHCYRDVKYGLCQTLSAFKTDSLHKFSSSPELSFVFRDPCDILTVDPKIPSVSDPFLLIIDRISYVGVRQASIFTILYV